MCVSVGALFRLCEGCPGRSVGACVRGVRMEWQVCGRAGEVGRERSGAVATHQYCKKCCGGGAAWMARGAQYTLPSMHCNTTTCIPLHCLHSLWTTSSLDNAAPALQTRRHYRYRGLGAAAIGSAPGAAFFFTAYEKSKHRLEPILGM